MAKKKTKPVANPARGFATTSVASKARPPNEVDNNPNTSAVVAPTKTGGKNEVKSAPPSSNVEQQTRPAEALQQLSPEELEEQLEREELQLLLDEQGTKIKRESQRQVTRMQTDSRLLRSQVPALHIADWLNSKNIDEILQLAQDDQEHLPSTAVGAHSSRTNETDRLMKLWTLEQVLAGLGYSSEQIQLALHHVLKQSVVVENNGALLWGIAESVELLATSCIERDLPSFEQRKRNGIITPALSETGSDSISTPQRTESPKPQIRSSSPSIVSLSASDVSVTSANDASDVSDLDSDLEPEGLISKYVSIKERLHAIQPALVSETRSKKGKRSNERDVPLVARHSPVVLKLMRQLEAMEADVLFDKPQAERIWEVKRIHLAQDSAARRKLNLEPSIRATKSVASDSNAVTPSESANESEREVEGTGGALTQDNDDDGMIGGLFSEPDEPASGQLLSVSEPTVSIKLRDFGKSSGLSPRRILEDACRSRDSSARLMFRQVSPTTYSCRHSVTISWTKAQEAVLDAAHVAVHQQHLSTTFIMTSIAAIDAVQSEAFISVVALFCIFSTSPKEEKVHLKLAPAWRDVWQELAVAQKNKQDSADRADLKRLRGIIREQQERDEEDGVVIAQPTRLRDTQVQRSDLDRAPAQMTPNDHFKDLWASKASSNSYQAMLPVRTSLPIFGFKEQITSAIDSHQIIILCGETGCGKSTQLPSYVLESELTKGHPCKIYCTEPRRISAISLAERVSAELGEPKGAVGTAHSLIGYAIRLESQVVANNRLIYATVGIVLRMLESSHGIDDITHLIIDEVHERSIDTDFLLIIVKALLLKRPYLKVILMSATVDAERFSSYFDGAPILTVPGRTYPVQTMFLEDAVELTKIGGKGNSKQGEDTDEDYAPEDGIKQSQQAYLESLHSYSAATRQLLVNEYDEYRIDHNLITQLLMEVAYNPNFAKYSNAFLVFLPGIAEIRELNDILRNHPKFGTDWLIYPLHSTIASDEQQQAFVVPPQGVRKVVLATNIAETGITIPDITCVIDTGKHKEMRFDERRQLSRLLQAFISRSNAKQRRGRAGRVQEGLCFHLFSKYRHDNLLAENQTPEMLRLSLQDLVMRVKICKLGEIEQTLGQALDPPAPKNIRKAIDALVEVGALTPTEELTALGQQLAKLPLDAVLGKLCLLASIFGCLDVALTVAAALSSKSPFVTPFGQRQQADSVRLGFKRGDSDLLTVYNAYATWRKICTTPGQSEYAWSRKNFLSPQTLAGIEDLKAQLLHSLIDAGLVQLSGDDRTSLNRYRYASRHRNFVPVPEPFNTNITNDEFLGSVIASAFYPKILIREGKGWHNVSNNQSVSLHPTSVNKGIQTAKFLSYYSIMQASNKYLNAQYTNLANDFPLVLMAGNADFRLYAGVVIIDGNRLRFSVREWKTLLAIKILRTKLKEVVAFKLKSPSKAIGKRLERWMDILYSIFEARTKSDVR